MKWMLYISFFISFISNGQGDVDFLFEELPEDSLISEFRNHSSLKPAIRLSKFKKNNIHASILGDVNYLQTNRVQYKVGLGGMLEYSGDNKWYFRAAATQGINNFDSTFAPKSFIFQEKSNNSLYTDIRSRASYTPNHIFNFQIGVDHNFIGEGSRSLFLSDYGTSYPFGLIRANFWRFEYSVLYQFFREKDQNRWEGKFASSHHVSFNATEWLNIGIFESVIFQPKDTNLIRGFDLEYLNPIVFYRPQEYSLGSSDNVLLGIELSADWKQHTFYTQFILDEFYLEELRAKSGWWANKFGGQFGIKGRFQKGDHKFFYRGEYNFMRPYTFSHISEELNYGNQGTSLAHPYGANFMEGLIEFKWSHKKWGGKLFANYYLRGLDKDGDSYGGNIYQPYINRPFEYGHKIGQGVQLNGVNAISTFSFQIMPSNRLNVFIENHFRFDTQNINSDYLLVLGIRSMLWNDYRNY